jgi:protein TonB
MGSLFVRALVAGVGSIAIALGLFVMMKMMITQDRELRRDDLETLSMDFVRLEREETVRERQRSRPEPPDPPDRPPPPPELQVESIENPTPQQLDMAFDMPFEGVRGGAGPFAGAFGSGAQVQDRGLIPMVQVAPLYPQQAAIEGIEGSVTFRITIRADGSVENAEVTSFTDRIFVRPAQRAILRWRFQPMIVAGQAVPTTDFYVMEFRLTD